MMRDLIPVAATLGSGVIAGVFFAFSSFVMPALARRPAAEAAAAMQAINAAAINRHFLAVFFGTALLALALFWTGDAWIIAGSLLYLGGAMGITVAANLPRNERLNRMGAAADVYWPAYAKSWTFWNHLRTACAAAAALAYLVGLHTAQA